MKTTQPKTNPENFRQGRVLSPLQLAPRLWRFIWPFVSRKKYELLETRYAEVKHCLNCRLKQQKGIYKKQLEDIANDILKIAKKK